MVTFTTGTSRFTINNNTSSFITFCNGTYDCKYCTLTCSVYRSPSGPINICTYKVMSEPKEDEIYQTPPDPEEIKFRKRQVFQKQFRRDRFHSKPLFKRKLIISISGWLTKTEYRKKKGHNKR